MKKMLALLLTLLMVFTLVACGNDGESQSDEETAVTLTLGSTDLNEDGPYNTATRLAKEYLEDIGSSVTLDIQTGGVLGGERELIESTLAGTIEICQTSDMLISSFIPQMSFLTFPGVMKDYDDVVEMFQNGWVGEEVERILDENDLVYLGVTDNSFRMLSNSKHEVVAPDDVKDILLRVPEIDIMLDFWAEMGVQTTPIAYGELATALQQGVVDGQEMGLTTYTIQNFYEFNKYYTELNYAYSGGITMMNKAAFESLSEKQQKELKEAFAYGNDEAMKLEIEKKQDYRDKLEEEGVIRSEASQELQDKIVEIGKKLANSDRWAPILGEDLIKKMYP